MVMWFLLSNATAFRFLSRCQARFTYQKNRSLVNVKFKWVKDKKLDVVVAAEKDLKVACSLVAVISSAPRHSLPIYLLSRHRGQLGLPEDMKLSTFIRRYPSVFLESSARDSAGTRVPCFGLTREALELRDEESRVLEENMIDIVNRLRKLLMLTRDQILPLQTIDQLKWDLGLPYDCHRSLLPRHSDLFSLVQLPDKRVGLKLKNWNTGLAISELQKNSSDAKNNCLAFPVGFTRGYGLKRKCMQWLNEWQQLPYTSPYSDPSHLDPRTDEAEKRIVGVFHELLHLTIQKKTERKNVSNIRKPLALPQKFTKVFERHPGIFYISKKCNTQTVILREAYDGHRLLQRHPLVDIREKFSSILGEGFLDRSRGLFKDCIVADIDEDTSNNAVNTDPSRSSSDDELDVANVPEYHSFDSLHEQC